MVVSPSPDVHLAPARRENGLDFAEPEHAHAGTLGRLEPDRTPWPGRTVTAGGVAMHVRETPAASQELPECVYVHGLAGSSTNWTDLAGLLSTRASGVAVDLPGFGRSEPTRSRAYHPAALTDALLCWLAGRREERGPVHLVGNSLGGLIAMNVAARHPELVRSLTLVSPAMPDRRPDPRRMSDPRMALAMVPLLGRSARRALEAESTRVRAERVLALCFADPARGSERRLEELIAESEERRTLPWAAEAADGATRGLLGMWAGRSVWSTAARTAVPTLVVWGERDRIVTSRLARRTAQTLPDGRLLVLPDVGHVAQMEAPETVARAVAGAWEAQDEGRWSRSGS
ncbi:alpha/beta fold hydrolase [Pseudonocardia endophytica]|nr:alpha/beta fold hydrolase [Pseudonocardia endophytica]